MKLTNEEFNALCESSATTYGLRGSVDRLITEKEAVTVERCVGAFRSGYDQALDDGCDANGAYECAIEEVAALSPDPKFLARKEAEARVEEAKWWHVRVAMVDQYRDLLIETRQHIAELERELAAMEEK